MSAPTASAPAAGPTVAARAARIPPFEVMDLVRAAREREASPRGPRPVLHLEVGQPSTPAPAAVLEAARAALDGPLTYTDSLGLPQLRERISRWYLDRHGLTVDPGRIAVTSGASAGCVLLTLACFDPGDRVAVMEPGYPCYRHILEVLGVDAVPVPVDASTRYQPTPGALGRAGPLDGVILASPSNPTGTVLTDDELAALADHCADRGVRLVSDEIYAGITSGRRAPTAASHPGTVVVQSFSKYFCMTGWRLGWLVLPPDLVRPVERLSQNLYLAPPTMAQHAAIAALDDDPELDRHVQRYDTNRRVLADGLRSAGVHGIAPAEGAFYVWADVSGLGDSRDLCRTWLDELAVAATPGVDFDPVRGDRFVRFSVAGTTGEVAEATERLVTWIRAQGPDRREER